MTTVRCRTRLTALATAFRAWGLCLLCLLVGAPAFAGSVTLTWDPPTGTPPAGYMVYYGPAASNYPTKIDAGNVTSYTISGLTDGNTYHFAATDYDSSHTESGFSNDVSATVPFGPPVASFTASTTSGTAPLALNFINGSTGSITTYAWTFGDGTTSAVASPAHVYAAAGAYSVSLTVTGPGGNNTQTRTNYVTVTAPPPPVAQFTGSPTAGTFPLTVNFTSTSTGSITSYAWTFGDGTTSAVASPSHVYAAAGVYTVALTVTGAGGSNTQTRTNYVTVTAAAPVAQFTGTPVSGVSPLTVNFTSTSTGSITSYAWTFGDGATSAVASPSHVYAAAGVYTVSLKVTGPGGNNTQTRTNYVTVTAPPPVAQFTGTPVSGVSPLTVTFTSTSTGSITSYAWTFGDGTTSAVANPSHVYAATGAYTVSLKVTGPGGNNTQSRSNYVTVNAVAPVAQFTGTPVSGSTPLTVNFTSTSTGAITSYAWNFGDGTTSPVANPSHVYSTAGVYTVSLTVTGPGGSNTQTRSSYVTVTVPAPVAQFTGTPVSGISPLPVNFTSASTGSITSYTWTFGDGATSAVANPSHVYAAAGVYTVSLKVTGPGGSNTQTRSSYVTVSWVPPDTGLYRKKVPGTGAAKYTFMLDFNFDHVVDAKIPYGMAGDVPLTGKVAAGGKSSLIVYRSGFWYIDNNRDGKADQTVVLGGMPGDIPLTANFTGAGATDALVLYRSGTWYVDQGLNGSVDTIYRFGGMPGDIPLVGDVNGDGIADLVIYRNGIWYIDTNRDGNADMTVMFGGMPQDIPMLFDWDGDGKADLCIFRDGVWYVNTKRDGTMQVMFAFGAAGDVPLVGRFH